MAKTKVSEYSSTASSNTDIDSINIDEGCAPSNINDAIRELMAHLKDWQSGTVAQALAAAGGGTGQTSLTANNVLLGNGTSGVQFVAPGSSGNVLTSNGTSWTSAAAAAFDSGTRMMFAQTSAPTGWTKDTTNYNNHALRVVTGTASSGGSAAFTTAFGTPSVSGSVSVSGTVGATTLTTAQLASHSHTVNTRRSGSGSGGVAFGNYSDSQPYSIGTTGAGSNSSHTHSFSGSGSLSSATTAINVQYVDVIIATKD